MQTKSPFYVVDEFISPLLCEDIIHRLNHTFPNTDVNNIPVLNVKYSKLSELRILPVIENLLPDLEAYYGFETEGILEMQFEWYVENFKVEPARSCSFMYKQNKWVRVSDVGFTGIIFLNDYNDKSPFDPDFEVYGGKLEFVTHRFGFQPKRGTMVFFPEAPNFVHTTSPITAGELTQVRFHVVPTKTYNYDMSKFPGNFRSWFPSNN